MEIGPRALTDKTAAKFSFSAICLGDFVRCNRLGIGPRKIFPGACLPFHVISLYSNFHSLKKLVHSHSNSWRISFGLQLPEPPVRNARDATITTIPTITAALIQPGGVKPKYTRANDATRDALNPIPIAAL